MKNRLKADQRKEKILDAAARLFRKKSFLSTTIDDLAAYLKINKATIYYHFETKGHLLYEVMAYPLDNLIQQAQLIADRDVLPSEKLKALVNLHLVNYGTSPTSLSGIAAFELKNLPRPLLQAYIAKRDKFEDIFRGVIREGISLGLFRENNINMTTRFILGLMNSVPLWFKNRLHQRHMRIKTTIK